MPYIFLIEKLSQIVSFTFKIVTYDRSSISFIKPSILSIDIRTRSDRNIICMHLSLKLHLLTKTLDFYDSF